MSSGDGKQDGNILRKKDVEMLRRWERVAPLFRRRYLTRGVGDPQFKEQAFREVYGSLIKQTLESLPAHARILKTDLWNEGVEQGRDLIGYLREQENEPVGIDVSKYVCESANGLRNFDFGIIQATLLASPFRPVFDFIIDVSTVDHMPYALRKSWVAAESAMLKPEGFLLISFDCRLNLFDELYHRYFTRKLYPEWTLMPSQVRGYLESSGLSIVREHAIFMAGILWGSHKPSNPFTRLLRRRGVFEFIKKRELSKHSRWLSFIAPQYVMVARKAKRA